MTIFQPRAALAATGLAIAVFSLANAQPPATPRAAPPGPAPLAIKQLKADVYMITGQGGNVTVVVTPAGLVLVDTKNNGQQIYDDMIAKIRTVSDAKIDWVIDTHHHADHTGNNARFLAAGAKVVGNRNLAAELDKFTPPPNNPNAVAPAKPNTLYDASYTISEGGRMVELRHFSAGHTDGDTVVWFPDLQVVSTGDEVVATTPNIDYAGGASIVGWIHSLDELQKLNWVMAIPGHGDFPMSHADVAAFQTKLKTLLSRAQAAVKAGATKDSLMTQVKTDDLWAFAPTFWNPARTAGLYAEAGGK
jgi:glyoxylase-like metal-dependent hydrolase (beta-lactamase superfamily II)